MLKILGAKMIILKIFLTLMKTFVYIILYLLSKKHKNIFNKILEIISKIGNMEICINIYLNIEYFLIYQY